MSRIGYSNQLVELINNMIEETETRRISLEKIQDVLDEYDKIGENQDGVSQAASEMQNPKDFELSTGFANQGLRNSKYIVVGRDNSTPNQHL